MLLPLLGQSAAHGSASISSFSPAFGQPGNVITINGSGFTTATNLVFNNATPTLGDFTLVSDSQLIAIVPIGATTGPLSIGTSSSGTATSSSPFKVAPAITSFSSTPTQVYILGANFVVGGTTVTFTGNPTPVNGSVTASTVVSATVPSGATTGPLTVTTSAGSAVSSNNFNAGSLPIITDFSPTGGAIGSSVIIDGENFFSPFTVKFGSTPASATITATTQITATVPTGATTGTITVTTPNGSFTTSSNFLTGTGPLITDFSPTVGTVNTTVNMDGLNLGIVSNVTFNGVAEYITGKSANSLQVNITNASGTGVIKIFSPQGTFTTSSNFINSTAPIVTDFSPTVAGPGVNVVINGLNFSTVSSLKFYHTAATFYITADTQISATVPSGALTGPMVVTSPSGSFTTSSNFFVTGDAPDITGFTPANGVRGAVITINGGNFTNLSSPAVQFNGVTATYTTPTSTTTLYATVPATATTGPISVKNGSGTGSSSALFYLQPWITSNTASGIVNTSLTIVGRNLTNASAVQVDGVNYTFTNSPTQIVALIPSNAMTGPITVTTPGGIFISTNSFVVLPKIYSFSPTIGPAGTIVTINGTSLFDVTSVLFNGTSATPFNIMTNQLQVAVPNGATPGPITVVTAGGNDVSSNSFTATRSSLLLLTKTVSPVVTYPGSNVTYTLLVTNEGPSTVTSVSVTDNIPLGFNLSSVTTSVGTNVYTNNMVIATLGILSNSASATITVKGTSPTAGSLTNTAFLGFPEGNLNVDDDFAFAYVYFVTGAQRTLSIAPAGNGGKIQITWPITTANFTLQVSTNLARTNGWQSPANASFVTNGLNEYTNSAPFPTAQFFRLLGP